MKYLIAAFMLVLGLLIQAPSSYARGYGGEEAPTERVFDPFGMFNEVPVRGVSKSIHRRMRYVSPIIRQHSSSSLVAFGRMLQHEGLLVSEHPAFGHVHQRRLRHHPGLPGLLRPV